MRAWLITWEGTDWRIREENKIVAILSGNRSSKFVEDVIDLLYMRETHAAYGMAQFANRVNQRRDKNRAAFSNGGRIVYGSDPFLYGRQVSELSVSRDEERSLEVVRWVEPGYYRSNSEANFVIEGVEPEKVQELSRPLYEPIGMQLGGR